MFRLLFLLLPLTMSQKTPTLYEYYTSGGVKAGLSAAQPHFTLNNKTITLYSGALHYFRVPPTYWRDRLRKLRAAGLNTVETYIPWNLHEPEPNNFDFGTKNEFLNIKKFVETAQEEDLLVILRPGPYICAEWEFGGLPSWLLRTPMKIRTSDQKFIDYVENYFNNLLGVLVSLQFTHGGPVIAFQIENEYGNTKNDGDDVDTKYLEILKNIMESKGVVELLFTSDTPSNGFFGTLPGVLATANFQEEAVKELGLLKEYQPYKPLMVMEYWTGWFDHWGEKHHTRSAQDFGNVLEDILTSNSSVNFYMFHGGTNWGFFNGANIKDLSTDNSAYQPDITSYDYDAPLSESGDYTDKYYKVKELITKHNTIKTKTPEQPELIKRIAYPQVPITGKLTIDQLIQNSTTLQSQKLKPMELLDINDDSGQSYGYIVYRKTNLTIPANSILKIQGHVCDTILVLINGELKSPILKKHEDLNAFGYWRLKDSTLNLGNETYENATLDLVVENWGRSNYGKLFQFNQTKGLKNDVLINEQVLNDWMIVPLEFKQKWLEKLNQWELVDQKKGPALYKGLLTINEVRDTYLDMRDWNKGFVVINGFILARYCKLGPQQTAYLPAPFLKRGDNELLVFEHFEAAASVKFVQDPVFETVLK